jgi:hypothetical protein
MARAHALLAALALAALPACDGPLLFAELEVPSVRVTLPAQTFPASDTTLPENWCDPSGQTDPPCIQLSLDYAIAGQVPVLNEPGVTYELRLADVGISLASTDVLADLAGVESARVLVLGDGGDPATAVVVASYVKPPGGGAPTSLTIGGNPNLDLAPYVEAGSLPVRVELVVSSGTPEFTADVQAGFSLLVNLDYGSLL